MSQKRDGDESEDDIGGDGDRAHKINDVLHDIGVPARSSRDHGVPLGYDGCALGQLHDVGHEGARDLEGNHGLEEYPLGLGRPEAHQQ